MRNPLLRVGRQEPLRTTSERPLPPLQQQREPAGQVGLHDHPAACPEGVSQPGLRLRQSVRIPGEVGRRLALSRRGQPHRCPPGPAPVGDQLRARPGGFRASRVEGTGRGRLQHHVRARGRHDARPYVRDAGGHLQEGPPARSRLSHLPRHRARILAALVRGQPGLRALRLAAWQRLRTARHDVPPAFQHQLGARSLPRGRVRRPPLPVFGRQAEDVHGDGRGRKGWRLPDRVRGPGSPNPRPVRRRAAEPRHGAAYGAVAARQPRLNDPSEKSLTWELDNVELTSVGVDVGSSTSHLLFSRLRLQRLAQSLSSRFVVVRREAIHRSPIMLTPFSDDGLIDAERLGMFVRRAYRQAGLEPDVVDTGAVIFTGAALEHRNARPLAELFSAEGGRFVCVSAGDNLEAILAAHGSGAVALSAERPEEVLLHLDLGGGTGKLALIQAGQVVATAAVAAGARLVVLSEEEEIVRVEPAALVYARRLGLLLEPGVRLGLRERQCLAGVMAEVLSAAAGGAADPDLLRTPPLDLGGRRPTLLTFSGGVAEYLRGRQRRRFGDLAPELAEAVQAASAAGELPGAPVALGEGIRATAIGASQFTVELSGNTVYVSGASVLPLRNLPVVDARATAGASAAPGVVEAAVRSGLQRLDLVDGEAPVAVALSWDGEPQYGRLRSLAAGLAAALPRSLAGGVPLVLALDADVGRSLGGILVEEFAPRARLACLDGLELRELDYLDVGAVIQPAGVVPVVVKSLAFPV